MFDEEPMALYQLGANQCRAEIFHEGFQTQLQLRATQPSCVRQLLHSSRPRTLAISSILAGLTGDLLGVSVT